MNASPWGRSDLMALAAVRYCLGRQSYIVGDCVAWLIQQRGAIDPSTMRTIERDIRELLKRDDEARERGDAHLPAGADFDRAEWLLALESITTAPAGTTRTAESGGSRARAVVPGDLGKQGSGGNDDR